MTLKPALGVGASPSQAGVAGALVDVSARLAVCGEMIARVADTLEAAVHVDASTILAHPRLSAFVEVATEALVGGKDKSVFADAEVRARRVSTLALETNQWIFQTFVNIHAGKTGG